MQVIKRDGTKQEFNIEKIKKAIQGANNGIDYGLKESDINDIVDIVSSKLDKRKNYGVEQIQDIVELTLMEQECYPVAKAFIEYRQLHKLARNKYTEMMNVMEEKLQARNVENQNANLDENTFSGREKEAFSTILKDYALNHLVSKTTRDNHLNNEIYIHDLDAYASGMHNCFNRNTKFITNSGIRTFENFKDGDSVKVLDLNGIWRDAEIRFFGKQDMVKVTFARPYKKKEVICTRNHRWVLADGSVTDSLSIGDILYGLNDSTQFVPVTQREKEMFCYGFALGDGCDHGEYIKIRLCKDKKKYSQIFIDCNYHKHNIKNSDDIQFVKRKALSKQTFLTNHVWEILSFEDKIALFNGYYAADGGHSNDKKYLWTSDERNLQMIKDISCLAGYHIFSIKAKNTSSNYKTNRILYEISFTTHYKKNSSWKVVKIERYSYNSPAWCVVEPITHTFTLADGMVTGNCLTIPLDDLLEKGFKVKQTDVRPAGSVNTAMQLAAVIMQLQSLCQFGGVAYSHFDWSMVPYIRKSFAKHYKDGLKYLLDKTDIDYEIEQMLNNAKDYSIKDSEYEAYSSKVYQYAIDMTKKETHQAVEALYHNLNN